MVITHVHYANTVQLEKLYSHTH